MIFSKTQLKIMQVFASRITEKFSIRQISKLLETPYPLAHRSIKSLIKEKFLQKDDHSLISLNYRENHSDLSYIESLRKEYFLRKNKAIRLFMDDTLESMQLDYFTLLVFGSYASGKQRKKSDVDILIIAQKPKDVEKTEKLMENVADNFSTKFHINVISAESAMEMLAKREEKNLMNETLNNHIILFGAENFYRLMKNAR